ncbi:MAG: hypothetical protein K0R51_1173 [Cytophagaceae bacterium]|jgi:hypothetical protein|nr:hypothetical protein [Cytophagaceae bacterium]
MELHIKPSPKNEFPLRAFLIRNSSVKQWVLEIQRLQLRWEDLEVYPIPGNTANSIWGCFVIFPIRIKLEAIDQHEWCQQVSDTLYIPERTTVLPSMTDQEIDSLLSFSKHVYHPDFGLVELKQTVSLKAHLQLPAMKDCETTKPKEAFFIPEQVKNFQIKAVSPEEVMKQMEESVFPKKEKMKTDPLNATEKAKLEFYRLLFDKKKKKSDSNNSSSVKTGLMSKAESFFTALFGKSGTKNLTNRLQEDFEELEKRNQSNVEKLLDMLKNNPGEALKYAIPLDDNGSTRGGMSGKFDLSKRWFDFSLFGSISSSNSSKTSGAIDLSSHYHTLQSQYTATAEELIKKEEYQKAAFVYMKLLKNYHKAAETLEAGKHYQEAATIYLKHVKDKKKAAIAYEKGKMTDQAIDLYKELGDHEKVGDLYVSIFKKKESLVHYGKRVEEYKSKDQYIKAALLCKEKMDDPFTAQEYLLQGWRTDKDAFNCLNNYLSNIEEPEALKHAIAAVQANDVNGANREVFVKILQYEYAKKNEIQEWVKDQAYEMVAEEARVNPSIVTELKAFNKRDQELGKDTLKFIMNSKKRS